MWSAQTYGCSPKENKNEEITVGTNRVGLLLGFHDQRVGSTSRDVVTAMGAIRLLVYPEHRILGTGDVKFIFDQTILKLRTQLRILETDLQNL